MSVLPLARCSDRDALLILVNSFLLVCGLIACFFLYKQRPEDAEWEGAGFPFQPAANSRVPPRYFLSSPIRLAHVDVLLEGVTELSPSDIRHIRNGLEETLRRQGLGPVAVSVEILRVEPPADPGSDLRAPPAHTHPRPGVYRQGMPIMPLPSIKDCGKGRETLRLRY